MTMNSAWKVLLLPLLLVAGCASTPTEETAPEPVLTSGMLDKIRSTRVVIGVDLSSQSQSQARTIHSGGQLGIIGAVVDVAINSSMESSRQEHERMMVAIHDAAINFNFGGKFKSEFEPAVRQVQWLRVTSVTREPSPQRGKIETWIAEAKEDAVLVTDVSYTIAPDLSGFSITANTALRLRDTPGEASARESAPRKLFRRNYAFRYPLEQPNLDKQQAARAWAENGGANIQRALQAGITDTVGKIRADLETFRELAEPAQPLARSP